MEILKRIEKVQEVSSAAVSNMLDFYQNLNINSGMLQDQCSEKNSLGCGQAGNGLTNLCELFLFIDSTRDMFIETPEANI